MIKDKICRLFSFCSMIRCFLSHHSTTQHCSLPQALQKIIRRSVIHEQLFVTLMTSTGFESSYVDSIVDHTKMQIHARPLLSFSQNIWYLIQSVGRPIQSLKFHHIFLQSDQLCGCLLCTPPSKSFFPSNIFTYRYIPYIHWYLVCIRYHRATCNYTNQKKYRRVFCKRQKVIDSSTVLSSEKVQ